MLQKLNFLVEEALIYRLSVWSRLCQWTTAEDLHIQVPVEAPLHSDGAEDMEAHRRWQWVGAARLLGSGVEGLPAASLA